MILLCFQNFSTNMDLHFLDGQLAGLVFIQEQEQLISIGLGVYFG